MSRFVILQHDTATGRHFDLMLESGGVLKTWSLPREPVVSGAVLDCECLPDHRLAYLDYEGPIAGDRGAVTRWDEGHYETTHRDVDQWQFELVGEKMQGSALLQRLSDQQARWQFTLIARQK